MARLTGHTWLCWLASAAVTLAQPGWIVPDSPQRTLFSTPSDAGACALLAIPCASDRPAPTNFHVYDSNRRRIPFRFVAGTAESAWLLVDLGDPKDIRSFWAYAGGGVEVPPGSAAKVEPDPKPIRRVQYQTPSRAAPATWSEMSLLAANAGGAARQRFVATWDDAGDDERPAHNALVRMQSLFLCPTGGVYRFALTDSNPAFLSIDGTPLECVSDPTRGTPATRISQAVHLTFGPHRVEVLRFEYRARPGGRFRLEWQQPGQSTLEALCAPLLLAATAVRIMRHERMGETLHPFFLFDPQAAYSFPPSDRVFIPVAFRDTSVNLLTNNLRSEWEFGDGQHGVGDSPIHVYGARNLYVVRMTVRDRLGFVRQHAEAVDLRNAVPRSLPLACRIRGLPAICYATDSIAPALDLAGTVPRTCRFEFVWQPLRHNGEREVQRQTVDFSGISTSIPLGKVAAGALDSIAWELRHADSMVQSGTVIFAAAPFVTRPVRVVGDQFYDSAGRQLVLIPSLGNARMPPPFARSDTGAPTGFPPRILCVDDSLAVPGLMPRDADLASYPRRLSDLLTAARIPCSVAYLPMPVVSGLGPAPHALDRLLRICGAIPDEPHTVIISLGLQDMLMAQDVDIFERQTAALVDLLASRKRCRIILATPPPYPLSIDRIRPFAAAIKRVGDARRIPVADLFSAFQGTGDASRPLFDPQYFGPNAAGQELAGVVLAAVIIDQPGKDFR